MMLTAIWDSPTKIHPYSLSHYSLTHSRSSAKGISYILPGKGGRANQDTDSHRNFKVWNRFGLGSQNFGTRPHQTSTQPKKKPHSHGAQSIGDHKKKNAFKFSKAQGPHCRLRYRWWANSNFGSHRTICDVRINFIWRSWTYEIIIQMLLRRNNKRQLSYSSSIETIWTKSWAGRRKEGSTNCDKLTFAGANILDQEDDARWTLASTWK